MALILFDKAFCAHHQHNLNKLITIPIHLGINKQAMKKFYLVFLISLMTSTINAQNYYTSNRGSDYYIYATWSSLSYGCSAFAHVNLRMIKSSGGSLYAYDILSHSGLGYPNPIGPSTTGFFKFRAHHTGWFCDYYDTQLTRYATTLQIKPPSNVYATYDEFDTKVVVTWNASPTHVPANKRDYRIYRDSVLYDSVASNISSWTDNTTIPGIDYVYVVVTHTAFYDHQESVWPEADTGRVFDLNVRTESLPTGVRISWDRTDNIPMPTMVIERREDDGVPVWVETVTGISPTSTEDLNQIPGYNYTYIVTPENETTTFRSDSASGKRMPNGSFSGKVTSPTGGPVSGVVVCADLLSDIPQDSISTYCDTTDGQGRFNIQNIYYYTDASFKITPFLEGHGFDPAVDTFSLELANHSLININFTDTSAFTISGQVFQVFNGDTCYEKDVEILVNDIPWGYVTGVDGEFLFSVGSIGEYNFKPKFNDHGFMPADTTIYIENDLVNLSFEDTTTYLLEGRVSGPCDIYIGTADLRIYGKTGECFETLITSNDTGYYSVRLPAREYFVDLQTFYTEDPDVVTSDEVETYFNTSKEADLREGNYQLNYIYRKTPELQVLGFDNYGCGAYDGIPIVEQAKSYTLTINVLENFGGITCNTDTGYVIVSYFPSDGDQQTDTLELINGTVEIEFTPDRPNIIDPYLNLIEVNAFVDGQTDNYSQEILVIGNRPREATFVSVSPEIPFLILRDPPGDASYSYLSESTTFKTALSISGAISSSSNIWASVKLGVKFLQGQFVFVSTETWGNIKLSVEVGASLASQTTLELSITNSELFSTSGNENITGANGDVFVGASLNMIYALTDIVSYDSDNCLVNSFVDLIMAPQGFETTFMYTENHIRNVLIPDLEQIHDLYIATENDSAVFYQIQIQSWEQILALNIEQKNNAEFIENRSFSAGTSFSSSEEITTSASTSLEYKWYMESTVAADIGWEFSGFGGGLGAEVTSRIELGASSSIGISSTTTTGYVLNDDDVGDFFSVDILEDNTYGTPVFNLKSGTSSCPWELGTQPRDGVQLLSNTNTQDVDNPDDPAVFILSLGNTSQSDEERTYDLVFLQESNPDGAVITLGGSQVQGGIPTPFTIPAGSSIDATVTVSRGPSAYDYNNIRFVLSSPCDGSIYDEVALTTHFQSTCSDISLGEPLDNWVINGNDENLLQVQLTDYDQNSLESLAVQVSLRDANSWVTAIFYDVTQLDPDYTDLELSFEGFSDGEYDIRAKITCGEIVRYSETRIGIVDRTPPTVFGLPSPTDGILDAGDIISVDFDENINCMSGMPGNVLLTNIDNNQQINTQVGCAGNKIIILADTTGLTFEDNTFRVDITGIEDLFGNMADTISWNFDVLGPDSFETEDDEDTDGDGIINGDDNCPLSYNSDQADMDNDGSGDICDIDIDGDDVNNDLDNCSMTFNPDQEDLDADGIGDLCDIDMDGDGVNNDVDNCPLVVNSDQEDSNSNGIGDACDVTGIEQLSSDNGYLVFDNYPNPFSRDTRFKYQIPVATKVLIKIYDVTGQEVKVLNEGLLPPGIHETTWFAGSQESGIYFYKIYFTKPDGSVFAKTKKLVINK